MGYNRGTQINPNDRYTGASATEINENASNHFDRKDTEVNSGATKYATDTHTVPLGTIVGGSYQIVGYIPSSGAEAELYICRKDKTADEYCLKLYIERGHVRQDVRNRLLATNHPNIAKLIAWGVWEQRVYEVWTLYVGKSLSHINDRGQPSNNKLKDYIRQINLALVELHRKDIVHQDIKPANIMVQKNGCIIILDFGVSAISNEQGKSPATRVGNTTEYTAPEVLVSNYCWAASDYYSLGITVYELLTGTTPYADYGRDMVQQQLIDMQNTNIPYIDKFEPAIQDLLVGLLQYDIPKRWGSEAVQAWICGNYDQYRIKRSSTSTASEREESFPFDGSSFLLPRQLPELVTSMAFKWSDGMALMDESGRFITLRNTFSRIRGAEEEYAVCNRERNGTDRERFYLEKLLMLYPKLPFFAWGGYVANSSQKLGLDMLEALESRNTQRSTNPFYVRSGNGDRETSLILLRPKIESIISNGLISSYLKRINEMELFQKISALEKVFVDFGGKGREAELCKYRIVYCLSSSPKVWIGGTLFASKESFINHINALVQQSTISHDNGALRAFFKTIVYNGVPAPGFTIWAERQGLGQAVAQLERALRSN